MRPAIRVENLSKRYRIGTRPNGEYQTLRDTITRGAMSALQSIRGRSRPRIAPESPKSSSRQQEDSFWSLKDVNFEIRPGEVVGIIGRNGAGKSTLLKILSRITGPTTGRIELHGRIGSLLEVGTGFHPELTGRENIYLNGSVLGMRRREIDLKFDQIVAFSEVERFLDTPVKRYSSGMYVRLAFAVAAHLDPEILLVDEVLAVGDATYQKRCLDRMAELANSGRTILFVSHNMQIIPQLCSNAILLDQGRVITTGQANGVIDRYLEMAESVSLDGDLTAEPHQGSSSSRFTSIAIVDSSGRQISSHAYGDDLIIRMEVESAQDMSNVALAVVLHNMYGMRVITSWTREVGYNVNLRKGRQCFECRFREVNIRPGHSIRVGLWLEAAGEHDWVENARTVSVSFSKDECNLSQDRNQGIVVCDYDWSEVEPISAEGEA